MKLLSWMHNRIAGKLDDKMSSTATSTYHASQEPREEFSDWPHGLLAIGNFVKKTRAMTANPPGHNIEEEPSSTEEIADFTREEVGKLQKELTELLREKTNVAKEISGLSLDRFLNCPSSLEVARRTSNAICIDSDDKEDIEKMISVILGKCKDISADNKNKATGKKSIASLLKKMFLCRSGSAPVPNHGDTLQQSKTKLLRTSLNKKPNSHTASRAPSIKKYPEDKQTQKMNEHSSEGKTNDASRWIKIDSEYIVLEI